MEAGYSNQRQRKEKERQDHIFDAGGKSIMKSKSNKLLSTIEQEKLNQLQVKFADVKKNLRDNFKHSQAESLDDLEAAMNKFKNMQV